MTTFDTMSLIRIKLKINHVRKECINGNVKHKELKYKIHSYRLLFRRFCTLGSVDKRNLHLWRQILNLYNEPSIFFKCQKIKEKSIEKNDFDTCPLNLILLRTSAADNCAAF